MNYRPFVFAGAVALSLGGAAIAQQTDFAAVQITATEIRPGVAVLFGNGGNIGVSHGPDGTLIVDDQFAPLTDRIVAAINMDTVAIHRAGLPVAMIGRGIVPALDNVVDASCDASVNTSDERAMDRATLMTVAPSR